MSRFCSRPVSALCRRLTSARLHRHPTAQNFIPAAVRSFAQAQDTKRFPSRRPSRRVDVVGNGEDQFSPILLRDLCQCSQCVDPSTKQKLFSTADIHPDIKVAGIRHSDTHVELQWMNDIPRANPESPQHITRISYSQLENLTKFGNVRAPDDPPRRVLWEADQFKQDVDDIDYEEYMQDDKTLHKVLQILHTHGLLFLTNVPESEKSVSNIAERIGPLKNTFYGYTWDVRSVPEAKNVAYTAQDLGFHMDLLYMHQPPHLQFLHCIRSSSAGGASLFTDSFRAVEELQKRFPGLLPYLVNIRVPFHYDHPDSQYYRQARTTVEVQKNIEPGHPWNGNRAKMSDWDIAAVVEAVSWSPPFQAPFSTLSHRPSMSGPRRSEKPPEALGNFVSVRMEHYFRAARMFSKLIHRERAIYERMMKPGECVLFDNRRVLHARRKFEVGDAGKERWLRGAYLDKDPYESRMRLLQAKYGPLHFESSQRPVKEEAEEKESET